MRNSKLFLGLTVSVVLMLCAGVASATTAGYTQFVYGEVRIIAADGTSRALKKGDAISEGDTVSTAQNASVQIKMQDGGFIAVRPETKLKFDSFKYTGKAEAPGNSFFSLFTGGFRAITGLIGRVNKKDYRITTPAATIGIRGTDHETIYLPKDIQGAMAGTYNKVNIGETSLTTNKGTINVLPNQMGYAGGIDQMPQLQPINTHIFTVAVAPRETKVGKGGSDDKQQESAQDQKSEPVRAAAVVDNTAAATGGGEVASTAPVTDASVTPAVQTVLPVTATSSTGEALNVTNQTTSSTTGGTVALTPTPTPTPPPPTTPPVVPSAGYAANHVAVETTLLLTGNSGMLAAPTGLTYVVGGTGNNSTSGALSSITTSDIGGGSAWTQTSTITGGTPTSANALAFATTGIQYGAWTNYTGQSNTWSNLLGGKSNSGQSDWMYGPQGYLDNANMTAGSPFVGTTAFTYQMDGANAPHSMNSGLYGSVTSASFTINFASMLLNGSMVITMPGNTPGNNEMWGASLASQPVAQGAVPGTSGTFFTSSGPASPLTVTHGVGTATICSTCGGNVSGTLTGQNFAGAILSYSLYDNSNTIGGDVSGNVAFSRLFPGNTNPAPLSGGTAAPTGNLIIATGNGSIFTNPQANTTITTSNVLTAYGSGTAANGSSTTTVTCPTCTATSTGQVATSGIYYGSWTAGSMTNAFTVSGLPPGALPPSYWITGPEAGPMYLPQALTGTASYVFDVGQVSNGMGVAGTVQGTTALSLDFNKQTVGINLDVSIADMATPTPAVHVWNAKTLTGNEAVLGNGQGVSGAAFNASTFNNTRGAGLLTISVDGSTANVTNASGNINGQLTGSGLTGAIMSFNLGGQLGGALPFENINGVAAFTGPASNIATPYRSVSIAYYEPFAPMPQPLLGFYANSAARVTQDATGNLTKFDIQNIGNNGGNNSMTLASNTSTLTNYGTDAVSGISWGRWAGGTINATDRKTGVVTPVTSPASLHWIAEPVATTAVTLPTTGTYTYTNAGGTSPTDNLGNVGTLNSASLSADFTAQTVNVGVNATVAGATLNAAGTNVPIIQQTVFYASSREPAASTSYLTVSCTGTPCGATGGTVVGKFTGAGAIGAAMSYGLQNGLTTISGVTAFHR